MMNSNCQNRNDEFLLYVGINASLIKINIIKIKKTESQHSYTN